MAKGKQLDATLTIHGDVDQTLQGTISELQKRLNELNKSAKRTEGFTVLKGAMANLAADGFQALVSGAGQAVQSLVSLAEETRELRQDLASLQTAYAENNFNAEQASATARSLFGAFGESDRAVEAANNIARMAQSQKDLDDWTRISTGAWATFQDALPVENLAEAAGETAKTGTVVGGLADALNWSSEASQMFAKYMGGDVVTAEDAFNKALSECSSEQERQQLITDTLLTLYGDAADQYEATAGSLMEANYATWDAQEAQARLGEIIEPLSTTWLQLKTTLMEGAAPALQAVADKAQVALQWLRDHPAALQALIIAAGVLAGTLTVAATALVLVGAAGAIASTGLLPIIGVIVAVIAVAGILAAIWIATKDTIINGAKEVWTNIQTDWTALKDWISTTWTGIKDSLSGIWDSIKGAAKDFASGVYDSIRSKWQGLKDVLTSPFDSLSGLIDSLSGKLGSLINKASSTASSIRSRLPAFASGGFTTGPSIAGEAGTEAVISFDPRYRADNLRYWQQAGSLLGVDYDSLSLGTGGYSSTTDVGGITFAPNITVTGNAQKQDIIDAIRETYPEFMDLIDEVLADREVGAYA